MNETTSELLTETASLLKEIIPVLIRNIQILEKDVRPEAGALQYLLQQEIKGQKSLLKRTEQFNKNVDSLLNENGPADPVGDLTVVMQDGRKICHQFVSDTLIDVIETIGVERVKSLNLGSPKKPLILTPEEIASKNPITAENLYNKADYKKGPSSYFIMTLSSTSEKIKRLEEIKQGLNLGMEVRDNR